MKQKPQEEAFENAVWVLLANMGFTTLDRDQHFVMYYGNGEADFKQIDVFAADDETILFVECKSAISLKSQTFKKEIEALAGNMNGLCLTANKHFCGKESASLFLLLIIMVLVMKKRLAWSPTILHILTKKLSPITKDWSNI